MSQPRRTGFLHKKGRVNPAFQSRWVVLCNGELLYFRKAPGSTSDATPLGKIKLTADSTVKPTFFDKHPHGFSITTGTTFRTYHLAARTYEDRIDWVAAINQEILAVRSAGRAEPAEPPKSDQQQMQSTAVVEVQESNKSFPHISGTTGTREYRQLEETDVVPDDDDCVADLELRLAMMNPLNRMLLFVGLLLFFGIVVILLTVFFTSFFFLLLLLVVVGVVFVSMSSLRSSISTWLLLRDMDALGRASGNGSKTNAQCKSEAEELFHSHVPTMVNTDVVSVFHKLRLFTKANTKWQFVRTQEPGSVWAVIGGKTGKTETYQKLIKILQDRAIENYHAAHGTERSIGEEFSIDNIDDRNNIKPLLQYNPSRFPLGFVGNRMADL